MDVKHRPNSAGMGVWIGRAGRGQREGRLGWRKAGRVGLWVDMPGEGNGTSLQHIDYILISVPGPVGPAWASWSYSSDFAGRT